MASKSKLPQTADDASGDPKAPAFLVSSVSGTRSGTQSSAAPNGSRELLLLVACKITSQQDVHPRMAVAIKVVSATRPAWLQMLSGKCREPDSSHVASADRSVHGTRLRPNIRMTRLGEALIAREQILSLVEAAGKWSDTNVGPVLTADLGPFFFLYLTPFYPRALAEKSKVRAPVKNRPLSYELNACMRAVRF